MVQRGNQREEERDWTNLPEGIIAHIDEISLAHDLLPYISLRNVCHHWRQATKNPVKINRRFRPHNWILIHPDLATNLCQTNSVLAEPRLVNTDSRRSGAFVFINFSSGERIRADIPELHSRYIRACIDGLLLITEIDIIDSPNPAFESIHRCCDGVPSLVPGVLYVHATVHMLCFLYCINTCDSHWKSSGVCGSRVE